MRLRRFILGAVVVLGVGSGSHCEAGNLDGGFYLFADQNAWDRQTGSPTPISVYRLDSSFSRVQPIAEIPIEGQIGYFGVYPRLGLLVFQVRTDFRTLLKGFRTDQGRIISILDTTAATWLEPWRLYYSKVSQSQFEVRNALYAEKNPGAVAGSVNLEGRVVAIVYQDAEVQLSDPGTYYGLQGSVVPVRLAEGGGITVMDSTRLGPIGPLPRGTIRDTLTNNWTLIANEPQFRAILALSNRNDQRSIELLIQNRLSNHWKSIFIEGPETRLKVVNGWMVGTIADFSPGTDAEQHVGYPPIPTDRLVIVNPISSDAFTAQVGKGCEALWITSDSTIIYRCQYSLFTARIVNSSLSEVRLKLVDGLLCNVHWAMEADSDQQ